MFIFLGFSYVNVGDIEFWMGGGFELFMFLLFVFYYIIGDGGMIGCWFFFRLLLL